jgi:Cdc6-like AAA superfamily ATPase
LSFSRRVSAPVSPVGLPGGHRRLSGGTADSPAKRPRTAVAWPEPAGGGSWAPHGGSLYGGSGVRRTAALSYGAPLPVQQRAPTVTGGRRIAAAELSGEQAAAAARALGGENLFITGAAGVGKSHLLRYVVQELQAGLGAEAVAVTAPTGIAAVNIAGVTVHIGLGCIVALYYFSSTSYRNR